LISRRSAAVGVLGAALAVALATTLAACSSSGPTAAPGGGVSSVAQPSSSALVVTPAASTPSTPVPLATTPAAPLTTPARSITPPPSTAPVTPSAPPSTSISHSAPPGPPSCSLTQLTVRGLTGGATTGTENALLLFTNSSKTVCTLDGFPRITLRRNGATVGSASRPGPGTPGLVTLGAGRMAQATISASTTCQAPESDQARIELPHRAGYVDLQLAVRACTLTAGAIVPAS
jgi:Protein of unknown function (DUF4232)